MSKSIENHPQTLAIHSGVYQDSQYNSVSTPIYQSSTFYCNDLESTPPHLYSRFSNPNRDAIQENLAILENGSDCFVTSSGTSAITLVLLLLNAGDHIICSQEVHGGTYMIIKKLLSRFNIESTFVNMSDLDVVKGAVEENTKMLWIESPTNPLLSIVDIEEVSKVAKAIGALSVVDNTLLTPFWQKPLNLGADISVHSTTKYINGHSDVVGGAIITKSKELGERVRFLCTCIGVGQAPFDAWLVLRGLKTLPIRLKAHELNAEKVVDFLINSSKIKKVFYPGLESHVGHEVAKKQQSSFGAMICFEVDRDKVDLSKFFAHLKIFKFAFSLGGVESIISHPWSKSHSCMSEVSRLGIGITPEIVRISVGLEHYEDLIKDLQTALDIASN